MRRVAGYDDATGRWAFRRRHLRRDISRIAGGALGDDGLLPLAAAGRLGP